MTSVHALYLCYIAIAAKACICTQGLEVHPMRLDHAARTG